MVAPLLPVEQNSNPMDQILQFQEEKGIPNNGTLCVDLTSSMVNLLLVFTLSSGIE